MVSSTASLTVFEEMKKLLLDQYPHKIVQSPCPDIQEAWDTYNQHVDSISSMQCIVAGGGGAGGAGGEGMSAKTLLSYARQIDAAVSRWLLSSDPIERRDIAKQCESIIQNANAAIKEQGTLTMDSEGQVNVSGLLHHLTKTVAILRGLETELGFTPASRSKVSSFNKKDTAESKNKFDDL